LFFVTRPTLPRFDGWCQYKISILNKNLPASVAKTIVAGLGTVARIWKQE
jgi:hypothetical protein